MIDTKFTDLLKAFLEGDPKDADASEGARLLVRINPRNMAYRRYLQLAMRSPLKILPKIVRELRVHLRYRLDGLTLADVQRMNADVEERLAPVLDVTDIETTDGETSEETLPAADTTRRGKRPDHARLPKKIRALWDDCADLYKQMKTAFNQLKTMNNQPACERYDLLHFLTEADKRYRSQMADYDAYQPKKRK